MKHLVLPVLFAILFCTAAVADARHFFLLRRQRQRAAPVQRVVAPVVAPAVVVPVVPPAPDRTQNPPTPHGWGEKYEPIPKSLSP